MKICFYVLRPDEEDFCARYARQYGIDYVFTAAVPGPENLDLAQRCDAVA